MINTNSDVHPGRRGAARVPAKGTCAGHPTLRGAATRGRARRAVWGPGTPPLFVLRFPCHG